MDKKEARKIAHNYILYLKGNNISVVNAYIFGSFATGKNNADSDIDLAVVINNMTDSFNTQVQLLMLRRKAENIIEPHPFDKAEFKLSNPFTKEIIKTGYKIL